MSGFLSGGAGRSVTRLEVLQIQSSAYGIAVPVVYGQTRIAGNLIWYNDFQSSPIQSGGKGGSNPTGYNYQAAVIYALCEGPVLGVPTIWENQTPIIGGMAANSLVQRNETYAVSTSGGSYAVIFAAQYASNISVAVPQGAGIDGTLIRYLSENVDYYRIGATYYFPNGSIACGQTVTIIYMATAGGSGMSPNPGLTQLYLGFYNGAVGQPVWSWLQTNYPAQAIAYSGITYVAGGDFQLGDNPTPPNMNFEVQGFFAGMFANVAGSPNTPLLANVPDADPAMIVQDILLNARYGLALSGQWIASSWLDSTNAASYSSYCRATGLLLSAALTSQDTGANFIDRICQSTNTALVWSEGLFKFIPYGDTQVVGDGVNGTGTYTPNVAPVYALTDANFLGDGNTMPITVQRKSPADCYNHVRVEFMNRSHSYAVEIAEAKDMANIDTFGLLSMSVVQAHDICSAVAAQQCAQLILQRQMYIRNQYTFKLPVQFSFLEPMDPVSLTDQWLGLSAYPVRIVSVEDADNDELTIIAEDFPVGISHSPLFNVQQGSGFSANFNADPGFADAPFVFEAPAEKTTTGLQIWIGCRPASPVTPNTLWGGCQVWVAMSAASPVYKLMGTVYANQIGSSRYGTLTGPIAGGALPIQLPGIVGQPSGQIGSGTLADMENNTSLIFVGGANPEYLSYETATPGSSGAFGQNYSLSPLQRGAYGTAGTVAHATSDPWILVDNTVIKSDNYDLSTMLGKTILIKLVSFNAFGSFGPSQSISNCTSASYTIQGYMAKLPPLPPSNAIAQAEPSGIRISWSPSPEQDVTLYELRQIPTGSAYTWANGVPLTNLGTLTPAQWLSAYGPSGTQVGGTSFFWAVQPSPGYTVLIAAVNPLGALAGAGQYSSTIAATVTVNLPTAVTGLTQQVVANELLLFWGPSTGGSLTIAGYQVWQGGTWSNATGTWVNTGGNLIGTNGPSTFTTWFGAVAVPTTYTFSVVPIDTAGNIGPPAYVVATIGTAPDYQLQSQYNTLFGGTKVNFVLDPIGYPTTTLNANDMAPGLTLTGQTVTVASLPSTWVGVRSYHGVNSSYESGVADANWYLEFTCNTQAGGWRCGLATLLVPLASSVGLGNDTGAGVHSFAYTQGGSILYDGTTLTSGLSALANGDIVGIAFNAAAGQVAFYRNGVLQYTTAITGGVAAGVYYPCISMSVVGNVGSANFGAQPFTYTVPTTFAGVSTPFGMIFPNPQDTTQGIFGPVDTTKSWTTHFTSNSWTTPQAQISAGYPIYAEPDTTGGTYEEVYDTGVTLSATTISVVLGTIALAGTVTITPLISWAPDNGSGRPGAWVSGTSGQYNTLATNFRFVRVTLTFSAAAGNNLLRISSMVTKLSIQQITDQGSATSGTSGNFTVTLNKTFVEITSIQITPQSGGGGTTTTYVGAAALPGANPTTFTGTIFDLTGTGKTGIAFNWLARGY